VRLEESVSGPATCRRVPGTSRSSCVDDHRQFKLTRSSSEVCGSTNFASADYTADNPRPQLRVGGRSATVIAIQIRGPSASASGVSA